MRLRHKPYAMDRINEYSHIVIGNPEERAGTGKKYLETNNQFTLK